jgi:hypothetical protein
MKEGRKLQAWGVLDLFEKEPRLRKYQTRSHDKAEILCIKVTGCEEALDKVHLYLDD